MFELLLRLALAAILVGASYLLGTPSFDLAWKAAAAAGALAVFGWRLDYRGLRGSGVAGFMAIADALVIASVLGSAHALEHAGFLVLAPLVHAYARYGASSAAMVPLASGSLFAAHYALHGSGTPTVALFGQAAGVLLIGLLMPQGQASQPQEIEAPAPPPSAEMPSKYEGMYFEAKDSYKRLRNSYQELERRTRRDRLAAQIQEIRPGPRFYEALMHQVRELLRARGVALLTISESESALVTRASSGSIVSGLKQAVLHVDLKTNHALMRDRIDQALRGFAGDSSLGGVILFHAGHVVGLLCVSTQDPVELHDAIESAEEMAPLLAAHLSEAAQRETLLRRSREAELRYEAASLAIGAGDAHQVSTRVANELAEILSLDQVTVCSLHNGEAKPLAAVGAPDPVLEALEFSSGVGLAGWLNGGAQEVVIFDCHHDSRLAAAHAVKSRVGSYAIFPLGPKGQPVGLITVSAQRIGGIDKPELETLRVVVTELGAALARLSVPTSLPDGCMSPREFAALVRDSAGGQLVTLEPLRIEALVKSYGKAAVVSALRKFAKRLRAHLPVGGALCLRPEGGFVAYVPFSDTEDAASWANETIALASMIDIPTKEGSNRVPFAMRSRVASVRPQESEVLAS